jgi:hypothetical protein
MYVHIRNGSIRPLTLAYAPLEGLGLSFRLQRDLGFVRLPLWAWVLVKTKFF